MSAKKVEATLTVRALGSLLAAAFVVMTTGCATGGVGRQLPVSPGCPVGGACLETATEAPAP